MTAAWFKRGRIEATYTDVATNDRVAERLWVLPSFNAKWSYRGRDGQALPKTSQRLRDPNSLLEAK